MSQMASDSAGAHTSAAAPVTAPAVTDQNSSKFHLTCVCVCFTTRLYLKRCFGAFHYLTVERLITLGEANLRKQCEAEQSLKQLGE